MKRSQTSREIPRIWTTRETNPNQHIKNRKRGPTKTSHQTKPHQRRWVECHPSGGGGGGGGFRCGVWAFEEVGSESGGPETPRGWRRAFWRRSPKGGSRGTLERYDCEGETRTWKKKKEEENEKGVRASMWVEEYKGLLLTPPKPLVSTFPRCVLLPSPKL